MSDLYLVYSPLSIGFPYLKLYDMQPIQTLLTRLQNDLEEVTRLSGRPCWVHFEYKNYILTLGMAKLESIQDTCPVEYRAEVRDLFSRYRHAHQNI